MDNEATVGSRRSVNRSAESGLIHLRFTGKHHKAIIKGVGDVAFFSELNGEIQLRIKETVDAENFVTVDFRRIKPWGVGRFLYDVSKTFKKEVTSGADTINFPKTVFDVAYKSCDDESSQR